MVTWMITVNTKSCIGMKHSHNHYHVLIILSWKRHTHHSGWTELIRNTNPAVVSFSVKATRILGIRFRGKFLQTRNRKTDAELKIDITSQPCRILLSDWSEGIEEFSPTVQLKDVSDDWSASNCLPPRTWREVKAIGLPHLTVITVTDKNIMQSDPGVKVHVAAA